jgi:hypothetical protein
LRLVNAPTKRSPLFWIALVLGGSCAFCTLSVMGVTALGALTADSSPSSPSSPAAATGGGGAWIPAGEIARGAGFSQQLVGGHWVIQQGGRVEIVKVQFANSALVDTNTNGIIHDLRFDDDGAYEWQWAQATQLGASSSRSSATEKGSWSLAGNTLTLTPDSQHAVYSNNGGSQEKEDLDLSPRGYQLVDITLETVPHTGAEMKRFPGVELSGPGGPWNLTQSRISLDLQRL